VQGETCGARRDGVMYEKEIVEEVRELAPDQQKEVLDFRAFLHQRSKRPPRRSIEGALSHLNVRLTEGDFREVRREMWKNFPD
jgi:hypothetical protein